MKTCLFLNGAEGRIQFGFVQQGKLLLMQDFVASSNGTELLTPALVKNMNELGLELGDISHIACVCGPGSFTGLRLMLTTASALAHSQGCFLAGFNYLELLANSVELPDGQRVRIITHARRDLVHYQDFEFKNSIASPCSEPMVGDLQQASNCSQSCPNFVFGSGIAKYPIFREYFNSEIYLSTKEHPNWKAFKTMLAKAKWGNDDLSPFYLRQSEAEDNLEDLTLRRGGDPELARQVLTKLLTVQPESII